MAKARSKWQPSPEDAISLAALQWFTHAIGQISIEVYATDLTKFKEMETVLAEALRRLKGLKGGKAKTRSFDEGDGCPEGYIKCRDGLCSPVCDEDPAKA